MKKRFLLVGALATTLTFGGLFTPKLVNAATPTTQAEEENNDYYVLPNGEHFLTKRTLKNGKTLEFYNLEQYSSVSLKGKALYDNEEFQLIDYNWDTGYADITNPRYDYKDKSTQKFKVRANPETYFPALTATKKVNDLIQKYKDPSKSMLPENVDKTSELYLDMKSCADEAIKDCKTEYDKIITLDRYVHKTIEYDIRSKGISLEKAWKEKKGVCDHYASIMVLLCQMEGIPSSYVSSTVGSGGHACVISYDSENKRWILGDPTNYVSDWDVHSWANQRDMVFDDIINLKFNDCYLSLDYNNKSDASCDDSWNEMENWTFELQGSSTPNLNLTQTELDGIPITKVSSESLVNNTKIKSVTLPSSITDVGYYSFSGCTSLAEVDLSQTKLTSIPNGLFKGCTSLKTIKLPSTITSIGDEAFYDCRSLTNIEGLDKCKIASIGKNAFTRCNSLESVDFSQATFTTLDDMFYSLPKLKNITLPETLTSISEGAFKYCKALEQVTFPASLTTIGESAFESCTKLKVADMSKTQIKELPKRLFANCESLEQVGFPSSLTTIGIAGFLNCSALAKVDLYNTALTTIGDSAFVNAKGLTRIALPDTISSIGTDAFAIRNYEDFVPTFVSDNVMDKVNYTKVNVAPWQGRKVEFFDKDDLAKANAIRFYGNGSTSGTPVEPYIYYGSSVRLYIPKCTYKKYGYLFTGWNSKPDGSGVSYKENAKAENPPENLYAQWKKAKYEITFVFNGGTLTYGSNEYEDTYTRSYTFNSVNSAPYALPTATAMSKPGYKFVAWYKNENCTGVSVSRIYFNTAEDMTLYAKWSVDSNHTHDWVDGECTICHKKCEHSNFSLEGEKAPTCKEEGFSGDKVCNDCGLTFERGHPLAKTDNHQWDKGRVTKEPSCKEEGEILYTCSVCKGTKVEALAKTDNHQWGAWRTTLAKTCTTDGKEVRECSKCSKTEERTIPATGHDVKLVGAKDSTCTSKGYSGNEVCKTCGKTIKTGHELPLAQHTPKKEEGVAATCTNDGHEGNTVCEVCGETLKEGKVISKLGHDWSNENGKCTRCGESHEHSFGEGTTIKELTCAQDGEIDYKCSKCGYIKKEITKATGHEWGEWKTTLAQTCTTDGKEERICSKCSEKEERTLKATGHEWGEWKTTLAQTCTTDGKEERICSKCSEKEERTLKATGHKSETVRVKAPTCKENGYTGDEVCKVCHETLNKGTTIPKTDSHEWGKWTTVRESTCTEKGEQSRKCTVCGEEEIESLPLAKHTWDNGKVTKAPSYTKVGIKTWTCKKCGKTKTTTLAKLPMPKAGTKVMAGGNTYIVTKIGSEVRFSKANANARAITVPSTIKAKGITYKVTSIGANAFKNCKKLTKATIGANVRVIKAKAFKNCPKLKTVTIKTVLLTKKTASKKCFSKVSKKMVIKVPRKVKRAYTKIFKGFRVR